MIFAQCSARWSDATQTSASEQRDLISGAREWINEMPIVPVYYLAKPVPKERAWDNKQGQNTNHG